MSKKDEKLSNFLPINRAFFDNWLWKESRTFSKAEAWLWLVATARFDAAEATELIGGKMIRWNRGELPGALRFLGEKWNWEKNQVDRFLRLLENDKMITRRLEQGQTIIRLTNYENYNTLGQQTGRKTGQQNPHRVSVSEDERDSNRDTERDSDGTAMGQRRDNTNKVNKVNKEESTPDAVASHPPTNDEIKLFEGFKKWVTDYAPRVAQMKEPFTIEEYLKLRKKMHKDQVKQILTDMHNWEPLIKKNRSSYLTCLKWKRIDDERGSSVTPKQTQNGLDTDQYKEQRKREEEAERARY